MNVDPQLHDAAHSLWQRLKDFSWLVTIGVQSETLIVYVRCKHWQQERIPADWKGFAVRIVRSGPPVV